MVALILQLVVAIPNLVMGMEKAFSGIPKSGASKWIGVEAALSQTIQNTANEIAKDAAPGTSAESIAASVAKFTKASNDAFVTFMNETGQFTPTPAPTQ